MEVYSKPVIVSGKCELLLLVRKFKLITDHKAIEFLKRKLLVGNARMTRWMERIENSTFNIVYREGSKMEEAD